MEAERVKEILKTTCEYQNEPLGIQNESPRFGWQLPEIYAPQSAYHILVYEENANICIWDSGRRMDNVCSGIEYEGKKLKSRKRYRWTLQLELTDGSTFLKDSWFETGIFKQSEWEADWIQAAQPKQRASLLLLKQFYLKKLPKRSRIYISGIGYYELYLNGQKVGDRVLEPGWTDYDKRVLYSVYDVGEFLKVGENTIGIWLGDGWYANRHNGFMQLVGKYPTWYGVPKAICELVLWEEKGVVRKIITEGDQNGGWLVCDGPILQNSIYDGEEYDARMEKEGWTKAGYQPDGQWKPAIKAAPPGGVLTAQVMPPIRETKEYRPVSMAYGSNRSVVVDFGQNLAGWVRIQLKGKPGQRVCLRYGEMTDNNGDVKQENLRSAKSRDCYILKGAEKEVYAPRFTYHGFRYLQVEADEGVLIFEVTAVAVHTDVVQTGDFSGSCEILNRIQKVMLNTEQNNLHSVPTDCPQRDERLAWLNDMTVRCEEALFNFDMILFYEKWLDDIADAQDEETGCIPDTAPYFYGNRDADHISSVYVLLPWFLYLFYGDCQPLKKHYEGMRRYIEYKRSRREENGLISEKYFGEWAPPMTECVLGWGENAVPAKIPKQLVTTGYLYYDCCILGKAAELLGKKEDARIFATYARETAEAINNVYFNWERGYYEPNIQGSNLFPLFLKIVPDGRKEEVLNHLIDNLREHDYHVSTGNQLTKYLFEVLREENRNEEAYWIASARTYPSIGYMLSCGATTIWERWEKMEGNTMNSHDHPMLGAFTIWFYKALAGICEEEGLTGIISLKPAVIPEVESIQAYCRTPGGTLESAWRREQGKVVFTIRVPWNTKVRLELPKGLKLEGDRDLLLASGKHNVICRCI